MIRTHENPMAVRAGVLSLLVHGVLLAVLLISFNWHAVQPASVAEVELWDNLPTPQPVIKPMTPEPAAEPPKPEPVLKPEPKPELAPEPKAEIQIKKEKPKPKVVEKPKLDLAKEKEKQRLEQIRKLQEMVASDQPPPLQDALEKPAAVSADEANKYGDLVGAKIRPHVNKQLCGTGKPELVYEIALLPTGEIIGAPRLIKSSGIAACDEAVDRAIRQSNPLPKPSAELLAQYREFKLTFSPNGDN